MGGGEYEEKAKPSTQRCIGAFGVQQKPEEVTTTQAPTTVQATTVATTVAETEHASYFEMLLLSHNVAPMMPISQKA